jgi:hypothetical protein
MDFSWEPTISDVALMTIKIQLPDIGFDSCLTFRLIVITLNSSYLS